MLYLWCTYSSLLCSYVTETVDSKSKARDNARFLEKRLILWKEGDLNALMKEMQEIQKRLKLKRAKKVDERMKAFCRFMLIGKVSKAMRFIDNGEDATVGVRQVTDDVLEALKRSTQMKGLNIKMLCYLIRQNQSRKLSLKPLIQI